MAMLYCYDGMSYPTVVARGGDEYKDFKEFKSAVDSWLQDHDIRTVYDGEQTAQISGKYTYTYWFRCIDEKGAVLAALRWT
jgi:hypothetical protein